MTLWAVREVVWAHRQEATRTLRGVARRREALQARRRAASAATGLTPAQRRRIGVMLRWRATVHQIAKDVGAPRKVVAAWIEQRTRGG